MKTTRRKTQFTDAEFFAALREKERQRIAQATWDKLHRKPDGSLKRDWFKPEAKALTMAGLLDHFAERLEEAWGRAG